MGYKASLSTIKWVGDYMAQAYKQISANEGDYKAENSYNVVPLGFVAAIDYVMRAHLCFRSRPVSIEEERKEVSSEIKELALRGDIHAFNLYTYLVASERLAGTEGTNHLKLYSLKEELLKIFGECKVLYKI